ncbi:oligosaccharide flippase family protein [Pseudomonas sp. gcc21]|uniref:lipopolysaccharide biosynthesis protein n=1 Tax=Pseudomonas sp. gcc21 TaxID=2726989 RepID=UPI0014522B09|nr:oligosaccharide flippase family protein [Pseudomonas sp. gcc21]QJD58678.1 oligosaccharide flippase family protein [Pseudomonas sp. gcc21]
MTLIRKAVANGLLPGVKIIVAFYLTRLILNSIGPVNFNVLKEVMALLSMTWVLQLGLNSYLTRRLPSLFKNGDERGQREIVSTVAFFYKSLAVLILLFGTVCVLFYVDDQNYKYAYFVCVVAYFFSTALSHQKAVLSSRQDFELIAKLEISSYLIFAAAMYVVCSYYDDYRYVFAISVVPIILPQLFMLVTLRKEAPVSMKLFSLSILKDSIKYSYANVLFTGAVLLITQMSFVFIVRILDTNQATGYVLAYQLITVYSSVVVLMLATLKPEYSKVYDSREILDNTIKKNVTIALLVLSLTYYSLLFAFIDDVILLWIGSDKYSVGRAELALLMIYNILYVMVYSEYIYLSSVDRHRHFGLGFFVLSVAASAFILLFVKDAKHILILVDIVAFSALMGARVVIKNSKKVVA